jgi:PAS domain-containing protein
VKRQTTQLALAVLLALGQPLVYAQTAAGDFEDAPALSAAELLPANLVKSERHTLVEPVRIEGFRAMFDLKTGHGEFRVPGRELAYLRIAELPAIEALNRIEHSQVFTDSLAKAAKAPLDFIANAISAPDATVGNVGAGAGTLLERLGITIRTTLDRVSDGVSDIATARETTVETSEESKPPSFTSDPFGYSKARRSWAKTVGVDPYSSNPVLQRLLDDAATASFAGSFAVDTALGLVAAPVKFAVGFDTDSRDAVWDLSPEDIQARLEKRLAAMGIEGRVVRDLFRNPWLTPTLQTALVAALEKLEGATGRADAVDLATRLPGEARLRGLIETLNLLAGHHQSAEPIRNLRFQNSVAIGNLADGKLVAAISADYLSWNAAAAELAGRPDLQAAQRTLLISGKASARARQEFERAGWALTESALPRAAVANVSAPGVAAVAQ